MNTYVTDSKDVADARDGKGTLNGKAVLLINSDMRTATRRIFTALAGDPGLAIVTGQGLSVKNVAGQWRRIGLVEFQKLVLDRFTLAREETGEGGRCRLRILSEPPHSFWMVSVMQGRWLSPDIQEMFQKVEQPKVRIVSRP